MLDINSFKYYIQEKAISKNDIFKRDNVSIFADKILKNIPFLRAKDKSEVFIGYQSKRDNDQFVKDFKKDPVKVLDLLTTRGSTICRNKRCFRNCYFDKG